MIDACLVYMPHQPPQSPCETIGLLSAQLKARGRTVRAIYANLRFLDATPSGSAKLGLFGGDTLIGDWACVRGLFGGDDANLDRYVDCLQRAEQSLRKTTAAGLKKALLSFRDYSESFLDVLLGDVLALEPRVVLCVIEHLQMLPSLALLKRVKTRRPDVVTIACTVTTDQAIADTLRSQFPWIDVAIGSRDAGGALAALPAPDYGDYFREIESHARLRSAVQPRVPVTMSRGCRQAGASPCFFCGLANARRPHERRSPARVLQELDDLYARYRVTRFLVTDPTAEMDLLRPLLEACRARGRPYRFFCEVSPALTRSEVRLLADGGVDWMQPGIESLDSRILRLANKTNRAWQNIQFLKWCGELGVRVNWNFLYGFPGEEDAWYEEMARLIPALEHLQPPRTMDRVRLCRGSTYFERRADFGVEPVLAEAAGIVYPLAPTVAEGLTQYFDDGVRRRREADDLEFISRLGFFALKKHAVEWRARFRSISRPRLAARCIGSQIVVEDTRSVARAAQTMLDTTEASLLAACREAPRTSALVGEAQQRGASGEQIEASIRGLLERRFIVPADGRMISLVLEDAA